MNNYFRGAERLGVFEKTGTPLRMGEVEKLVIPDYQVLRNLVKDHQWDQAIAYLTSFHTQNITMNSIFFGWCKILSNYYAELTSIEKEKSIRPEIISDFHRVADAMKKAYSNAEDIILIEKMKQYFSGENLLPENVDSLVEEMNADFQLVIDSFNEKNEEKSLMQITRFNRNAVIRHDSFASYVYSYPSTVVKESGEKIAVEVSNGSILKNQMWLGMWELIKVITAEELAAFLSEHLRFHFSGKTREGSTQIVEDDKMIRLIFDPCGSGGALRRRLEADEVKLQEKHQLAWNKCGEVNLYCSHCALNEKFSIELFGYPKIVVDFQDDANKPCGWTIYKDKKDVPQEVFDRLGMQRS